MEPIYFSKIIFTSRIGHGNWYPVNILMIDIPQKEISFQKCKWVERPASLEGIGDYEWIPGFIEQDKHYFKPAVKIKNGKTGFEYKTFPLERCEQKIIKSVGLKLEDYELEKLLPFCNALEFEEFRKKGENWKHVKSYYDEITIYFQAITDSYIPMMEMNCDLMHDKGFERPHEKLRDFLISYMNSNEKYKDMSLLDF